jgi:hypothetical protein
MTTARRNRHKRNYRALSVAAALLISALPAQAEPEAIAAPQPPPGLPMGSIVAFLPDPKSENYSDLADLKRWLGDRGWAICDGSEGTPDLSFRIVRVR